jgi:hypothetical protein
MSPVATQPHVTLSGQPHVTLSGDIAGEYVVKDRRPDGELRLVPDEYPATVPKYGGRRATPEEFERHFGDLPTDDEG